MAEIYQDLSEVSFFPSESVHCEMFLESDKVEHVAFDRDPLTSTIFFISWRNILEG